LKIHLVGDINSPNTISSRCRALFKYNIDNHEFKITNIKVNPVCIMLESGLLSEVQKACSLEMDEPDICINMKSPEHWIIQKQDCKNIGWVSWGKQSKIPKEWADKCNEIDKVLVSNQNDYDSVKSAGVLSNITIINEPIDYDLFRGITENTDIANVNVKENGLPIENVSPSVLVQHKQGDNASILEVLEVLCSQYKKEDMTVVLRTYINSMNMGDNPAVMNMIQQIRGRSKSSNGPTINLLTNPLADEELAMLYNTCSIVINTDRRFGINQTILQSSLCDTVSVTHLNNTSETELLSKTMSIFDHSMSPVFDGDPSSDHWWATPNQKSLKKAIDKALDWDVSADELKEHVAKNHNPKDILEKIIS